MSGEDPGGVLEEECGFSSEESEALDAETRQARLRDRALSDRLGGPEPHGQVASSRYLQELGRRPRLPAALERELIADAKGGDRRARAQLIEAFLPAIASVARVYRGRGEIERAELMQEGVVGLLRALERYDPARGVPFWGYAVWWVRHAMQQLVAELSRPVVLSDHALRQLAQLRDVHAEHLRRHGREPTAHELAAASGVDREDVDNLLATERPARSLEAPAGGGEDGVGRFGELLSDPLAEDEYERVVTQVAAEGLRGLLSGLSERERWILSAHYGLDGPAQSLREIAVPLGLSAERVRQLERRAVGKLRAGAGADGHHETLGPESLPSRPMRTTITLAAALLAVALPASVQAQEPPTLSIGQIQGRVVKKDVGTAHRSPYTGQVVRTQGVVRQKIVTRTSAGQPNYGFFLQSTEAGADGNPLTSDGIFVFQSRFRDLIGGYVPQVGDEILVEARVTEFFNLTELTSARRLSLVRSGVDVAADAPAVEAAPPDDLAEAHRWWERREGMAMRVPAGARAISGRDVFASTLDGEVWVMRGDHPLAGRADPYAQRSFRDPHPLDDLRSPLFDNGNGYRILLGSLGVKGAADDSSLLIAPVRTFDRVKNELEGGVYYSFGKYSVQVAQQPQLAPGVDPAGNAPPRQPDRDSEYSVANYNVENLYDFRDDPTDGCDFAGNSGCPGVSPPFDYVPASDAQYRAKLEEQAEQIDRDLHRPDIVLVQEAEDQDICSVEDDALVCGQGQEDGRPDTLQELALAIEARSGVRYAAALDRDGADDRGIVSGFLYRTDRVQLLRARADDPVLGSDPEVEYRAPGLAYNGDVENPKVLNAELPDDLDRSTGVDGNAVFTRPPQVARFRIWREEVGRGSSVCLLAVSNHFSSTPDARVGQRTEQSRYGAAIVNAAGAARVLFGGDLNVFPRPDDPFAPGHPRFPSDQLGPLYDEAGLVNLWDELAAEVPASAYTYVFQGQAQTLDHQFVSPQLAEELQRVRVAHINADWPKEHEGDGARGASDHDPVVSGFEF